MRLPSHVTASRVPYHKHSVIPSFPLCGVKVSLPTDANLTYILYIGGGRGGVLVPCMAVVVQPCRGVWGETRTENIRGRKLEDHKDGGGEEREVPTALTARGENQGKKTKKKKKVMRKQYEIMMTSTETQKTKRD